MVMTFVIMVMVVAATCAVRTVIVMMFMLVVVIMMVLVLLMVVMVMLLIVLVVDMMMFVVMIVFVVIVIMVMASACAVRTMVVVMLIVIVVMMVVMCMLFCFEESSSHIVSGERILDRLSDLNTRELFPRCSDDLGVIVDLADQFDRGVELTLCDVACTGQDDRAGILDLVLVELLEVLQVDLALARVDDGNGTAYFGALDLLNSSDYVREFADAGGLDEDTIRSVLVDDFLKSCTEVAYERAADAAGVHLGDLDAGFFQESAVDTDLAEFVLDEDELLTIISVRDKFLDECGLSGA